MTDALVAMGRVFEFLIGNFTAVLGLILTEPVLTIMFGIMVTGAIIGLAFRVMSRG